jgi:GNAT superfamily N-acetyltransferase
MTAGYREPGSLSPRSAGIGLPAARAGPGRLLPFASQANHPPNSGGYLDFTGAAATARGRDSVPLAGLENGLVPSPGITSRTLRSVQAAEHETELRALHAEVYAAAPYQRDGGAALFARRFRVQRRQPGFVLAEARHGDYLIGYATGMPLRPSTSWWRDLTTPLPADITAEHQGRTFAVTDLLVRAAWRRQGTGRELHDLLLGERGEERATAVILPAAAAAQAAFRSWGWRKVGRAQRGGPGDGPDISDVPVAGLPLGRGG